MLSIIEGISLIQFSVYNSFSFGYGELKHLLLIYDVNKLGEFGFKFLIKRFKGSYKEVLRNFIKYLNKLMMMSAVTIITLFVTKFSMY